MSSQTLSLEISERFTQTPEPRAPLTLDASDRAAFSRFAPLIQKLAQARQRQSGGLVTTFAAVSAGHGVTFVVEELARELAKSTGQAVLVTSPAALADAARTPLRINDFIDPQKIWRLSNGRPRVSDASYSWDSFRVIRERFGFVLVDCPPLNESSEIFTAAAVSDGLVLVVAAGQAKRTEVEEARRLLSTTSAPFLGLVLNKHKSAIPKFLAAII